MISKAVLSAAAIWLVCVGVYAFMRPERALATIGKFASTPLIHFGELGLRSVVGAAFIGISLKAEAPDYFRIVGGFLIISAFALMIMPRAWHAKYSRYWSQKLSPGMVRIFSPLSVFAGGALLWLIF